MNKSILVAATVLATTLGSFAAGAAVPPSAAAVERGVRHTTEWKSHSPSSRTLWQTRGSKCLESCQANFPKWQFSPQVLALPAGFEPVFPGC